MNAELQQCPAERIVNHAENIITLSINIDETMSVLEKFGDSENGLDGLAWLVKRALGDIEDIAIETRDDAKQRAIDSEEMERIAGIAPVVVKKAKVRS